MFGAAPPVDTTGAVAVTWVTPPAPVSSGSQTTVPSALTVRIELPAAQAPATRDCLALNVAQSVDDR